MKGLKSGGHFPKITKTEKEILRLIKLGFNTPSKVSKRRKTSIQAASQTFKSLKKKGLLNRKILNQKKCITTQSLKQKWRVHGLELNIKVLYSSDAYKKKIKSTITIRDTIIHIFRNSIRIYSEEGLSFWGSKVSEAFHSGINYFEKIISLIEQDLNIILRKDRFQNIKISKCHISNIDNSISRRYKDPPIKVKCTKDLKLWCITDDSFNLNELEFIHPETYLEDSQKMEEWLTDFRDTELLTNSDIRDMMAEVIKTQKTHSQNQREIMTVIKVITKSLYNSIQSNHIVAKNLEILTELMTGVSKAETSEQKTKAETDPATYIG